MTKESVPIPKIKFNEDLANAPYSISIEPNKIAFVLKECMVVLGEDGVVSASELSDLKIKVRRDSPEETASFVYKDSKSGKEKRVITITGDDVWQEYVDALQDIEDISNGLLAPDSQFEDLLYTSRLEKYLTSAPRERAVPFAVSLIQQAANRELSGNLIHELSHFLDRVLGRHRFWYAIENVIMDWLEPFIDRFDPTEKQAERIESKLRNDPRWRSLVSVTAKKNIQNPRHIF